MSVQISIASSPIKLTDKFFPVFHGGGESLNDIDFERYCLLILIALVFIIKWQKRSFIISF